MQPLLQEPCIFYDTYVTEAEPTDCGGCAIATLPMGHGPVSALQSPVACGSWTLD